MKKMLATGALSILLAACAKEKENAMGANDTQWRERLTAEQFRITQQQGTEAPFSGAYWNHWESGTYSCVCCGQELFRSDAKFDAGCGWPSYFEPVRDGAIEERPDTSHGMVRTEVRCARCGAHLGHLFHDGPPPTGLRYCINSAALSFRPDGAVQTKKEPTQRPVQKDGGR